MQFSTRIVAAAAAAVGMLAVGSGVAQAAKPSSAYQAPVVKWVQPVVNASADGTAVVHGHYTCFGGNAHTHLFQTLIRGVAR